MRLEGVFRCEALNDRRRVVVSGHRSMDGDSRSLGSMRIRACSSASTPACPGGDGPCELRGTLKPAALDHAMRRRGRPWAVGHLSVDVVRELLRMGGRVRRAGVATAEPRADDEEPPERAEDDDAEEHPDVARELR